MLPSATAIATGILVVFSGLFGSLLTLRIANPQVLGAAPRCRRGRIAGKPIARTADDTSDHA